LLEQVGEIKIAALTELSETIESLILSPTGVQDGQLTVA